MEFLYANIVYTFSGTKDESKKLVICNYKIYILYIKWCDII